MKTKLLSIAAGMVLATSAFAQIPNNSFENWTTVGSYSNPNQWSTLNATTSPFSVYTCTKGTGGAPGGGSFYIQLTSKSVLTTVAPAIATNGTINTTTYTVQGGSPYTARPQSLTGSWQYMAFSGDQGVIGVTLTKWNTGTNSRDTIAYILNPLSGMVMSWTNFSIPFIYKSVNFPDSCQIILSASGANGSTPAANSYLYVDNMAFAGSVGIETEEKNISQLNLFPNPANDVLNINLSLSKPSEVKFQLLDISGKLVKEINAGEVKNNYKTSINTTEFTKGVYFLKVISGKSTEVKKVIIE
jgi:hypothetical protein